MHMQAYTDKQAHMQTNMRVHTPTLYAMRNTQPYTYRQTKYVDTSTMMQHTQTSIVYTDKQACTHTHVYAAYINTFIQTYICHAFMLDTHTIAYCEDDTNENMHIPCDFTCICHALHMPGFHASCAYCCILLHIACCRHGVEMIPQ